MAQKIEISDGHGNVVGSFAFDESPVVLQASRTAAGFNLQLPFSISLAPVLSKQREGFRSGSFVLD